MGWSAPFSDTISFYSKLNPFKTNVNFCFRSLSLQHKNTPTHRLHILGLNTKFQPLMAKTGWMYFRPTFHLMNNNTWCALYSKQLLIVNSDMFSGNKLILLACFCCPNIFIVNIMMMIISQ